MRSPARAVRGLLAALVLVPVLLAPAAGPAAAAGAPTAATVRSQEWWLDVLHVRDAWRTTKGSGVTVGLVDSGVDATHPDLRGALVPGKDFSGHGAANGEAPVSGSTKAEHGTNMAGYIAARGHGPGASQGLVGVAPQASVQSTSVLLDTKFGVRDQGSVGAAIRWNVDHGAKVINLSVGVEVDSTIRSAVAYAQSHDVVLVVATGNDGQQNGISNLAALPGVVAVSGFVDETGFPLDPDSNYNGPETLDPTSHKASDYLGGVAVSGPFSTHAGALDLAGLTLVKDGSYDLTGGTSNATAIVSGVVALIRSAHRNWTAAQVIDVLIHTAYRKPGSGYSGHGFGIPDVGRAVAASAPSACENPLGSLATNSAGIWPTINANRRQLTYTPRCDAPASSGVPSSSAPTSSGRSLPATASSAPSASGAGGSSGGVPGWVWIVVAVVVVGGAAVLLLARRGSRRGPPPPPGAGGTGGWPQQPPPPGWSPPPSGSWSPPPGH